MNYSVIGFIGLVMIVASYCLGYGVGVLNGRRKQTSDLYNDGKIDTCHKTECEYKNKKKD
jgi:hypothetical protein